METTEVVVALNSGVVFGVRVFGGKNAHEKAFDCVKELLREHRGSSYSDISSLGYERVLEILHELSENDSFEISWHECEVE